MPGLYTHTSSAAGTVVTATLYNGDHDNHADNQITTMMDDYSTDAAQMQSVVDPYPAASESLATNLTGELQRIRYILRQHLQNMQAGAGTYWYEDPIPTATGFYSHGCHVKRDALFSCADAAWTLVPFNLEEEDFTGWHDNAVNPGRITIPDVNFEGKYLVSACIAFSGHTTGYRGVRIVREVAVGPATEIIVSQVNAGCADATVPVISVSSVIHLLVDDYITCEAYQSSGAAMDLTLDAEYAPRFMAWRIGR